MSKDLELALKIKVDKKDGETNLTAFNRAFKSAMSDIGKSSDDVDAFGRLIVDLKTGKKAVEELDAETKQLYDTYSKGAQLAADKDILGVRAHAEIQKEIDETRQAYDRLKKSGTLTQQELAQAALKTEERIRELKHETNGWTDALQAASGSIAGLAASAASLAVAAGYAIDFESSMADVRKVVEGTDEQFDGLTERLKDMTGELPITAQGLAEIAAAGGQLGVPIEKLDQFVELAAKIGVAFDLSTAQAGDAVAKLSNIFDIPIENVEQLGDAINVLGNTTAAREADILDVLTRIGGTAKQFKLTAEQGAALAATMIAMGAKAEVAGTGINALLSKLQTANVQSPEFKRALEGIGISAVQLGDDIRNNPQKALTDFLRTLEKLDDQARAETLTKLFGQEYQDDIARLLNGLDKYDQALARVNDTGTTAGAMQREFAERMKTTEAEIQLMQNGLQEVAINLGTIFLPAIREAAVAIGDVSRALADFVEANPAIATIATTLATVAVSAGALRLLFLSLGVVGAKAFGGIGKEIAIANTELRLLSTQVGKTGAAFRVAGGIASAAWIGWDIGTQLREQFVEVERAGIALAAGLTKVAERIKFIFDVIDTGDWDASLGRLEGRLKNVDEIYGDMFADTYKPKEKLDELGNAAAAAADKAAAAAQTIRDNFAKLDLTSASGIIGFTKQIDAAKDSASLLTDELKKWIAETKAADLQSFQDGLVDAFVDGKLSAEKLTEYNQLVLSQSFTALGVTAETALGKISPAAQEAIGQIDLIEQTLTSMAITGTQKMGALEVAIRGAVGQADTQTAVQALRDRVAELGESGDLTAAQMKRLSDTLDAQSNAINQITPGIQSVEDAMRSLGVTSQAELQKAADSARLAYEQVKLMGGTLEDQKTAFIAYAQTVIAANQNVTESQRAVALAELEIQAAVLGVTEQFNTLAAAGESAGNKVAESAKKAAASTRDLGTAAVESSHDVQAVAASLAEWFVSVRAEMSALSAEAGALFDDKMGLQSSGTVNEVDALKAALSAAHEELGKIAIDNIQVFDPTGVNRWKNSVLQAKNETVSAYNEQKLKFLEYTEALQNGETLNASFIRNAETAVGTMKLLGSQDLATLRSAIDSATQKLESMREAAKATRDSLQDELDRINGNQANIDKNEYERKKAEAQKELENARLYGDQQAINYWTEALKLLDQVRSAKAQKAREDAASSNAQAGSGAASTQTQSTSKTYDVNVNFGGEKTKLAFANEASADSFLSLMNDFKNRSGG